MSPAECFTGVIGASYSIKKIFVYYTYGFRKICNICSYTMVCPPVFGDNP